MSTNKFFTCGFVSLSSPSPAPAPCGRVSAAMSAECGRVNEIKVFDLFSTHSNNTQKAFEKDTENNQLKSHGFGVGLPCVRARGQSVIGINKL